MVNPAEIMPVLALALAICFIPLISATPPATPKPAEDRTGRVRGRVGSDGV